MRLRHHFSLSSNWIPLALGQFGGVLCGLVGIRLVSAWIPADTLGIYGLFLILTPVASLFTHAGLAKHAAWQWSSSGNRQRYLNELWRASLTPTFFLCVLVLVGWIVSRIANAPWHQPAIWVALLLANLSNAYALVFQSALQSSQSYWRDASVALLTSLGRTFLPLILYKFGWQSLTALTTGFAIHALLAALWALFNVRRTVTQKTTDRNAPPADFSQFHISFAVAGILTVFNTGVNRWIGAYLFDAEKLGFFTLASNLANVLPNVLSGICWQFFFPQMASAHAQNDNLRVRVLFNQAFLLFIGVIILAGVTLWLLLPHLIGPLIDTRYTASLVYLMPLYAHGTALAICYYSQGLLHSIGQARASLQVTIVGTFILCGGPILASAFSVEKFLLWLWISPFAVLVLLRPWALHLFCGFSRQNNNSVK